LGQEDSPQPVAPSTNQNVVQPKHIGAETFGLLGLHARRDRLRLNAGHRLHHGQSEALHQGRKNLRMSLRLSEEMSSDITGSLWP